MATNDKAVKGEENRKTTEDTIPGKEKSKNRREEAVPANHSDPDASDPKSNQDEPKAEKQSRPKNDNKDKGDDKPKKKTEEQKSKN